MGMVFGFKLHALTNLEGLFERWAFAAANHPDVRLARELVKGLEGELVLGDKAYIGSSVLTPKRSNMTRRVGPWGSNGVWSESLDRVRTRRVRLWTRANLKIAAFNLLHSGVLFR